MVPADTQLGSNGIVQKVGIRAGIDEYRNNGALFRQDKLSMKQGTREHFWVHGMAYQCPLAYWSAHSLTMHEETKWPV